MAISKERLEELIEQGATIYPITDYVLDDGCVSLKKKFAPTIYKNGNNNYILYVKPPKENYFIELFGEDLFETREDMEFAFDFQNLERVDKLSLPTWKKFIELDCIFRFLDKNGQYVFLNGYFNERTNSGFIKVSLNVTEIADFDFSKENYLKACSICRQLFLKGEVK